MAAPLTLNLLAERLYHLGVEAGELAGACHSPPGAPTTAQREYLLAIHKILKPFVRAFNHGGDRSAVHSGSLVTTHFEARSATELSAHYVLNATTMTTVAAGAVIAAVLVGQNQTTAVASIIAGVDAHPNSANITTIAVE